VYEIYSLVHILLIICSINTSLMQPVFLLSHNTFFIPKMALDQYTNEKKEPLPINIDKRLEPEDNLAMKVEKLEAELLPSCHI